MDTAKLRFNISNGFIPKPNEITSAELYRLLHTAVYDGLIPVSRVVGFKVAENVPSQQRNIFSRNTSVAEDNMSIACNLSKLLFFDKDRTLVGTDYEIGVITTENLISKGSSPMQCLFSGDILATSLKKVSLHMRIREDIGYKSAKYNFDYLLKHKAGEYSSTTFIPVPSNHDILDFVAVKPPSSTGVELMYMNGMNDSIMQLLLDKLSETDYYNGGEWRDRT